MAYYGPIYNKLYEQANDDKKKDTPPSEQENAKPVESWDRHVPISGLSNPPSALDATVPAFQAGGASGGITVDSNALKWYAEQIDSLLPLVQKARDELEAVEISPGRFRTAQELKEKVEGDHGIAYTFSETFRAMIPAIGDLSAALRQLAADYTTSEQLNSDAGLKALGMALADFDQSASGGS